MCPSNAGSTCRVRVMNEGTCHNRTALKQLTGRCLRMLKSPFAYILTRNPGKKGIRAKLKVLTNLQVCSPTSSISPWGSQWSPLPSRHSCPKETGGLLSKWLSLGCTDIGHYEVLWATGSICSHLPCMLDSLQFAYRAKLHHKEPQLSGTLVVPCYRLADDTGVWQLGPQDSFTTRSFDSTATPEHLHYIYIALFTHKLYLHTL